MSDKERQILQKLIPSIEQNVEKLESLEQDNENAKEQIQELKQKLEYLKDIAWDRQSKKESSQMFNVLEGRKEKTEVKSNVGSVVVDSDLMQKVRDKHLDDPALRGMITSQETLSFPKVAKNVKPEYNEEINDYTWKTKASDKSILAYGSRKYEQDGKEINRLLTTHSKTERGQRQADRVSSATYFNDPDCRGSAHNESITQNEQTKANDENILIYGSRKYELNDEEVHRLATNHSKTKANERTAEEDRRGHPYHPVFNDLNFCKSANENIIPQKDDKESQIKAIKEATKKTSLKLGLGENSKNNTNIELDKSKDIDLDPKR